jgi:hypothetical protein
MIITLLSSIGGGIRFRENFLEEVFDLNDITEDLESSYYFPLENTAVAEESEPVVVKPPSPPPVVVPAKKIEEETAPAKPVPVQLNKEPSPLSKLVSQFQIIEGYSGEAFAAF